VPVFPGATLEKLWGPDAEPPGIFYSSVMMWCVASAEKPALALPAAL